MILVISFLFYIVVGQKIIDVNDSLNFIALGDWGGKDYYPYTTPAQLKNAKIIKSIAEKQNVSFIISAGDNFYQDGISSLNDPRFKYTFENVYLNKNSSIKNTPWFVVAGNHDHRTNHAQDQIEYSKRSNIWNFPDYLHTLKVNLKYHNKSIKIIFIDTIWFCKLYDKTQNYDVLNETSYDLLEKELIKSKKDDLIIAVGHHPIYTRMFGRKVSKCINQNLRNLLEKYLVNIYISGHDHTLQHHVYNNKYSKINTHLFVTGAGSNIYNLPISLNDDKNFVTKFYWKESESLNLDYVNEYIGGFLQFIINRDKILTKFIDSNGNVLYQDIISF